MTLQSPSGKSRAVWHWAFYAIALLALIVAIAWATMNEAARNPAREATTDLGPAGPVTIRFSTSPSPPLPTGPVTLSFMPMDARQRTVSLEAVTFEYGREGSEQAVGSGQGALMSDGSGMFMGNAQFPQVGNWWLKVRLSQGGSQSEVRFTFYVEPAQ